MALSYKNDSESDERLNPAHTSRELLDREHESAQGINHPGPDFTYDNTSNKNSSKKVNKAEGDIPYESTKNLATTGPGRRGQKGSIAGKVFWKRKGPMGVIIGIAAGGGMLVGTLSPALAGMSFIENTLGDLNDKLASLNIANNKILRNKLVKSAKSGAVTGCSTVSIRCKMNTFSKSELARMQRAGIEVIPDGKTTLGRTKASGVKFRGVTYTADAWATELSTNTAARTAQLRANNMNYRAQSVNGPFGKVLARFGVSKKAPGLSGSKQDRLNQLMTAAGASDARNVRFVEVVDENGNKTGERVVATSDMTVSSDGTVSNSSDSVKAAEKYTQAEVTKIQEDVLPRTTEAKPASATKKASIGAASILGYADLACSIKNMVTGASVAAKIANEAALIKYAMPLLSSINKIKAGDGTPEDAETIGDFLTEVDTRRQIEGVAKDENGDPIVNNSGHVATGLVDNPNYGLSAMDARTLSMSTNGGVAAPTETMTQYSLGLSMTSLFAGLGSFALQVVNAVNTVGGKEGCAFVQHPLTRIAGIVVSVAAGVASGGIAVGTQAAIMGAMIGGMYILEQTLNYAFSGDITEGLSENPVGRGEALWTGMGALEGATNRVIGMKPSNAEEIDNYYSSAAVQSVERDYIAMKQEDAQGAPLDITNQYSFLGSLLRTTAGNFGYSSSPTNILSGIVNTSMAVLSPLKATATGDFNADRYKMCMDEIYLKLGIEADVQCNVRYTMPDEALALEVDDVIEYMDRNNYVSTDSETGLPDGYTPPDQRGQQNAVIGALTGMTIGQFVDNRNIPNNDYARYLEACVYRTAPYGDTGEESGLLGGLSSDWSSGAKCRENSEQLNMFRMYTLFTSVLAMNDEEEDFSQSVAVIDPETSTPTGASTDGDIAWPLNKALYASRKNIFLKGHGTSSGTFVKPGGRTGKAADLGANSLGVSVREPIYSVLSGTVTRIGGGHAVIIRSSVPGGTVDIAYAHGYVNVKVGDTVTAGQQISAIGNLGNSRGAHLHIDMNYNQKQFCPQDLFIFMNDNPGKLPNFQELVSKASRGTCSRL